MPNGQFCRINHSLNHRTFLYHPWHAGKTIFFAAGYWHSKRFVQKVEVHFMKPTFRFFTLRAFIQLSSTQFVLAQLTGFNQAIIEDTDCVNENIGVQQANSTLYQMQIGARYAF